MLKDGVLRIESERSSGVQEIRSFLDEAAPHFSVKLEKYLSEETDYNLFVALKDYRPRFCLGLVRWVQMPAFSLLDFRSLDPDAPIFTERELLNELFEKTLSAMHAENRFTFYYATRVRKFPKSFLEAEGALAPVRGLSVFERYDFTVEAVIPTGTTPKYQYQFNLISRQSALKDYWIKRGTLKTRLVTEYLGLGA